MANELDETKDPVNEAGRDVAVIEKQLPIKVGWGSKLFEAILFSRRSSMTRPRSITISSSASSSCRTARRSSIRRSISTRRR